MEDKHHWIRPFEIHFLRLVLYTTEEKASMVPRLTGANNKKIPRTGKETPRKSKQESKTMSPQRFFRSP